jgi:hypothetical protein
MSTSDGLQWQRLRRELNHDWLKNIYLPRLGAWMSVLQGEVEDVGLEVSFLHGGFSEWCDRSEEIGRLLASFESAMSPRTLLDEEPLCKVTCATRAWLEPVVHEMWRARVGTRELVAKAERCLTNCATLHTELSRQVDVQERPSADSLRCLAHGFDRFLLECARLSRALSRFPDTVRVT